MNLATIVEIQDALKELLVYGLGGTRPLCAPSDKNPISWGLLDQDYLKVLHFGKENLILNDIENLVQLQESLEAFLKSSSVESQLSLTALGVASLQLFVDINWLGGNVLTEIQIVELFPWIVKFNDAEKFSQTIKPFLLLDSESYSNAVHNIELFFVAKLIFDALEKVNNSFTKSFTLIFWHLRLLNIHQQILEDKSELIYSKSQSLISTIDNVVTDKEKESLHYVHYLVEIGAIFENFYQFAKAKEFLDQATKLVGLDLSIAGALGKRTKFQLNDHAQLTLNIIKDVESLGFQEVVAPTVIADIPKDVKLEDEVRLDRIQFKDEDRKKVQELNYTQQVVLLGHYFQAKRSKPKDDLTQEELAPYLDTLLQQTANPCWTAKMVALLHRSLLENDHSRTIERSLFQLESLVDAVESQKRVKVHRFINVYSSRWIPYWCLESELIKLQLALGTVKTALDRALKIQWWECVIECYQRLNLKHKAAEIIRQQIDDKGESAHLLCLLGDATGHEEHYRRALEVSNNKSSRAFKSLGIHHYFRKEYQEAVEHFQKSLDLNSFQLETLLRLGYSAIQIEAWEIAASAYRKYCTYESENFEAWNNLSNSYIKLGQKSRAWKVLQEAVKCDYDNWKIWDNILVVSTDCAEFDEVFRSYHRILDLKDGKHVDLEVLKIIVKAINTNVLDNSGDGTEKFRPQALKLFGRITSNAGGDPKVWELYARLTAGQDSNQDSAESTFKAAQFMQKALGAGVQKKDWWRGKENCIQIMTLASETADYCLKASEFNENKVQSIQQLASLKLMINLALSKAKASQISQTGEGLNEEVVPSLETCQKSLQLVLDRLEELKK